MASRVLIKHPRTPYYAIATRLGKMKVCCAAKLRTRGYKVLHIPTGLTLAMLAYMDECRLFVENFERGFRDPHEREVLKKLDWVRACAYENNDESGDDEYEQIYRLLRGYADNLYKVLPENGQLKIQPEFI